MSEQPAEIVYESAPSFGAQYLKFFIKGKKRFDARPKDLVASAVVKDMRPDKAKLAQYREACGFPEGSALPLLYPHILTSSMHMSLMARDAFPLSPLGAVHARNHILQRRPLSENDAYHVRCAMDYSAFRVLKQGAEVDVVTHLEREGEVVWESVSTYLFRGKFGEPGEPHPLASLPELDNADQDADWPIPGNMGKRYAKITGDYNPIHINKYAAKLFGFSSDIIHGMWNLAQAINHLPAIDSQSPQRLDALFKGPSFIGATMTMKYGSTEGGHRFDAYCGSNPRPVIVGRYATTTAEDTLL